jgi:hypothetical protein
VSLPPSKQQTPPPINEIGSRASELLGLLSHRFLTPGSLLLPDAATRRLPGNQTRNHLLILFRVRVATTIGDDWLYRWGNVPRRVLPANPMRTRTAPMQFPGNE